MLLETILRREGRTKRNELRKERTHDGGEREEMAGPD